MLENGTIIDGKYKILNKIGQGGMSVVYLAMNEKANKQWAIKEVRKDVTKNFDIIKQGLITETNLLKKLSHPNLPSIIDVIDGEDTFLIVMDYIEGVPLSVKLEESGAQSQEDVIDWALQLCDVLNYLHTRETPIIFRDMKPGNVMLKPNGDLILIDFGIAREYKSKNIADTTCLGTQGYAAPEQFGGQGQTDQRTDIYCLGATLYHLITNHNPSEPPYEIYPIRRWDNSLSSGLEEIIIKCTQRNPRDRYQNCNELRYALEHYMELDIEYKRSENNRLGVFLGLCFATVCCLGAAIAFDVGAKSLRTQDYDKYLEEALAVATQQEATEFYEKAIQLEPNRSEAYMALLNKLMDDDNLTEDEAIVIREMLQDIGDGDKNYEEQFKENGLEYDEFCYQLGLAYFYSYENIGNKNNSKKWLQIAANSTKLPENKVERAARLLKIAEYYSKIGVQSKSGDESTSYKDYWEDLSILAEGNIVQVDNAVTALMIYNEMAYQVATNAQKFDNAGVSKQQMIAELKEIITHLTEDVDEVDKSQERIAYLMKKVLNNIKVAERELETNFSIVVEKEDK